MIFPIGDDQVKGGHFPLFSYGFIILNSLVFMYELSLPPQAVESFFMQYGSIPAETLHGENLRSLFTSMFVHGGWMHIIGNMLFLWVFADNIEATIGSYRFLIFYLVGGLVAHASHIYFNPGSVVPTVGASGAIAAVMGAYLVMFPRSQVKIFFFFLIFRISAFVFLGIWIWQQWMSGTASIANANVVTDGTAWWAHIGGFVFGVIAGFYYRGEVKPDVAYRD
ncbi:MAG: rhomboid family intramembrane serine protease [Saprospiraceae bacterium]|nr:MAG: rhomboid family intramembrane serine protease [Saprospiraceae bacterium]